MIKSINMNFLIKWAFCGEKKTHLIGAGQYYKLVGNRETANKHFLEALESGKDKYTAIIRNKLRIEFISR